MTPGEPESPHVDEPTSQPSKAASRSASRAAAKAAAAAAAAPPPRRRLPRRFPAVVFFVLGGLALWAALVEALVNTVWAPDTVYAFITQAIPPLVAVLIPGALLWRHPDAWKRARTLMFGTLVYASVTFFQAIEGGLQATFKDLTPPPSDLTWFIPASIVYTSFVTLIGLFGLLYIGFGLSKMRNYAFTTRSRNAGIAILIVGAISIAGRIWTLTQLDLANQRMTTELYIYVASVIVIGILTILVWTYLARLLMRCAIAGEEPELAWLVAAIGATLVLLTYLVVAWSTFVTIKDGALTDVVLYLRQFLNAFGSLLLLIGFFLGLPSFERVVWPGDEPAAGSAD